MQLFHSAGSKARDGSAGGSLGVQLKVDEMWILGESLLRVGKRQDRV